MKRLGHKQNRNRRIGRCANTSRASPMRLALTVHDPDVTHLATLLTPLRGAHHPSLITHQRASRLAPCSLLLALPPLCNLLTAYCRLPSALRSHCICASSARYESLARPALSVNALEQPIHLCQSGGIPLVMFSSRRQLEDENNQLQRKSGKSCLSFLFNVWNRNHDERDGSGAAPQ